MNNLRQQYKKIAIYPKILIPSVIILIVFLSIYNDYPTLPTVELDLSYLPLLGLLTLSGFLIWLGGYIIHDYFVKTQEIDRMYLVFIMGYTILLLGSFLFGISIGNWLY